MTIKLDKKSRKILSVLDMHAREPLSAIAKKAKLSRDVVNYRIKQMEKNGIIQGYYTVLDTSKLGKTYCRIFLKYDKVNKEREKALLDFCTHSAKVVWVTLGEGKWDVSIAIITDTLREVEQFYDELNRKFGIYFRNPYVTIAFQIFHFKHKFLYDETAEEEIKAGESLKQIKVDKKDYDIINFLSTNARASMVEIAEHLHTTPKLVNYRIKRLIENKVILGFRARINTRLLGYDYYKIFLNIKDLSPEILGKMHQYLKKNPNTIFITKPIGIYNLEFEIMVKNANEMHEMITHFREEFSEVIDDYEVLLYYDMPLTKKLPG